MGRNIKRRWHTTLQNTSRKLMRDLVDFHKCQIRELKAKIRLLEGRLQAEDSFFTIALATINSYFDDITAHHFRRKHRKIRALYATGSEATPTTITAITARPRTPHTTEAVIDSITDSAWLGSHAALLLGFSY